jgi:hypothetical protein
MHVFRLVLPYPATQARLVRLLSDVHKRPTRKRILQLHNQSYAMQRHANAEWSTPSEIVGNGLTDAFILLTDPFHEYMQTQLEALFATKQGIASDSPESECHALTVCNTLFIALPRLRITLVYSAIIIEGIGNGELVDGDRHFEDLVQQLVDLRTSLRVALLMALHPRLGADASLSWVGEDVLRNLC